MVAVSCILNDLLLFKVNVKNTTCLLAGAALGSTEAGGV